MCLAEFRKGKQRSAATIAASIPLCNSRRGFAASGCRAAAPCIGAGLDVGLPIWTDNPRASLARSALPRERVRSVAPFGRRPHQHVARLGNPGVRKSAQYLTSARSDPTAPSPTISNGAASAALQKFKVHDATAPEPKSPPGVPQKRAIDCDRAAIGRGRTNDRSLPQGTARRRSSTE